MHKISLAYADVCTKSHFKSLEIFTSECEVSDSMQVNGVEVAGKTLESVFAMVK